MTLVITDLSLPHVHLSAAPPVYCPSVIIVVVVLLPRPFCPLVIVPSHLASIVLTPIVGGMYC
jgi:hypothetical protein